MRYNSKLQSQIDAAPRWPVIDRPVPPDRMPRHIAIIMDGNGRWATQRGKIRINGHRAGVESVRACTRYCGQTHVEALTLYAFSTENWKRPQSEIRFLFRLLKKFLISERAELLANSVRLTSIGNISGLPEDVQAELRESQALTAEGRGLNLCLALNYGSHDEILEAARSLAAKAASGKLNAAQITAREFESELYTAKMPPVDLLIRTAGERRLSNFLLWQASGAEYVASPVCWPEFQARELEAAVRVYAQRIEASARQRSA
jgi:undecaprenyl diphosphate synthase